jgi:hypothetical protein
MLVIIATLHYGEHAVRRIGKVSIFMKMVIASEIDLLS